MYGSTHAVKGNYSELNPNNCGITRLTNGFDDMCFKWHNNPNPPMIAGRNATENEVPWIVRIERKMLVTFEGKNITVPG